MLKNC